MLDMVKEKIGELEDMAVATSSKVKHAATKGTSYSNYQRL